MHNDDKEIDVLDDVQFDYEFLPEEIKAAEKLMCDKEKSPETQKAENTIPLPKPKDRLVNFLTSVSMEMPYSFMFPGTRDEVNAYIQAMRVELSRMRKKVRKLGKRQIQFKVQVTAIMYVESVDAYSVTMLRTQKEIKQKVEQLDDAVVNALTK